MSDDYDYIVKTYRSFLCEVARHTTRINPAALCKCAMSTFRCPRLQGDLFGKALAGALSHVIGKAHSATSGSKLAPATRAVYTEFAFELLTTDKQRDLWRELAGENKAQPRLSRSDSVSSMHSEPEATRADTEIFTSPTKIYKLYHGPSPKDELAGKAQVGSAYRMHTVVAPRCPERLTSLAFP